MRMIKPLTLRLLIIFGSVYYPFLSIAQSINDLQYQPFAGVKAWSVLISDWQQQPKVNVINTLHIKGHGTAAQKILGRPLSFTAFKAMVNQPAKRSFLPLNLFDIRSHQIRYQGKYLTAQKIDFAIQLIDYQYQDTPTEMAATAEKTVKVIEQWLKTNQMQGNIAVVLADNKANKMNTDLAQTLAAKNILTLRINDLKTQNATTPKIEVLNAAQTIGYLRYIKAGSENDYHLTAHDIAIYERLPDRVPILAGIITLEPQTPLSHTALLAKNRGTLNMYIADWQECNDLKHKIGDLIQLTATADNTYHIEPVSQVSAEAFWKKSVKKINITPPQLDLDDIADFGNGNRSIQTTAYIGAKAANYALLQRHFPTYVRKGFAIPFMFYHKTIQKSKANTLIEHFLATKDTMKQAERQKYLKKIRKAIKNSTLSPDLLPKLQVLLKKEFPNTKIRLRSSTNCEDLPDFNGAGLYESKGFYTHLPSDSLAQKILGVYASLWSDAAFEERDFFGIDHRQAAMSILVHEAFTDEITNGVALTVPTKTSHYILVNIQEGDNLVTNPKGTPFVLQMQNQIFTQPLSLKNQTAPNPTWAAKWANNTAKTEELRQLISDIHALLVPTNSAVLYGVDVEFRMMQTTNGQSIFVKQARLLRY